MRTLTDEHLRAYFLGKLSESEADVFEEECAASAELTERAQMVERELTDDYLCGNLSPADKNLFEEKYLITEARVRKLDVARGLWMIARKYPHPEPPLSLPASSFWNTLFGRRNALQFAAAGLVLLLVFGAITFCLLYLNVNKTEVAEVRNENPASSNEAPALEPSTPQTAQNPDTKNENPKSVSIKPPNKTAGKVKEPDNEPNRVQKKQFEKPVSTPKNIELNKPVLAIAVKLIAGSMRDEGEQFVRIAPNVKNINFLLNPAGEPNNYKIYRAVLKTAEDDTVYISPNLKALSFMLPTVKLENRTYMIFLEGRNSQNQFESIAEYTFRVRR